MGSVNVGRILGCYFSGSFQNGRHFVSFPHTGRGGVPASYNKSTNSSGYTHLVLVVVSLCPIALGRHMPEEQSLEMFGGSGPGSCLGFLVRGRFVGLHGACYSGFGPVDYRKLSGITCTILRSQSGLVDHGVLRHQRVLGRL